MKLRSLGGETPHPKTQVFYYMSYSTVFAQKNIIYSRNRRLTLSRETQGRKMIVFLLILLIILFGILYIIQANNAATEGYKIQEYKNKIAKLRTENENIELELSQVRSLGFLEEKVETLKMVKIGNVEYISPVSEVAAR